MKRLSMIVGALLLLLTMSGCQEKDKTTPLMIQPIEGIREDFIRGVDISTLIEMETLGQVYYDEGKEKDLIEILKDHGVNWVRIRVWNDPYDVSWSDELSGTGQVIEGPIGAGTCDVDTALALSKRVKAAGMSILLDFHYSDFWADPGKQYKPDAWQGMGEVELEEALYDFTFDTLNTMAAEDCLPDMVQVGNEVNNGLVWPEGKDITSENAYKLLAAGSKAVRDIEATYDAPIKVMIHLAEGGDRSAFVKAFDALTDYGLDYDVIGASYYPYWHGSLTDLQLNLKTLEERYNKEVLVAEVAYGYGDADGDATSNIFNSESEAAGGYKASVQGQATLVRDVMAVVSEVRNNRGLGIFYWEPAWLTPEGAGWITGAGNAWENQAMFDIEGNALDSLDVFYAVYGNQVVEEATFQDFESLTYTINQGQKVTLPYRVKALYSNHRYDSVTVKWDNLPLGYNETPGTYTVEGYVEDLDKSILASVAVLESSNVFNQGGFEGSIDGLFRYDNQVFKLGKEGENPFTGYYALNYWNASDFTGDIMGDYEVENGTYDVSVWVMGASLGTSNSYLFVGQGDTMETAPLAVTGFNNWVKYVIQDVVVTDGHVHFGIHLEEAGGSWGWIDDFEISLK